MLEITDGYKSAIVGDVRQMFINAILDISDPDLTFGNVLASSRAAWSRPEQLYNKEMEVPARYATLERNRWLLDGTFPLLPNNYQISGEVGFVTEALSGDDGSLAGETYVELQFSNVSVLQACSVYFSDDLVDGVAADFTVSVLSNNQVIYTKPFTDNDKPSVSLDGFTVYGPTSIRVDIRRWSLPGRRARVLEIIPGIYEKWKEDMLASLDIQMRANFAGLAIPYGTCTLRMDNLDRRFEPRRKNGIFKSIEERQAIQIAIGTLLADGTKEYKQVGVFYQYAGGWTTGDNAMTMEWHLADIIGLLSDRDFIPPAELPTTLAGWIGALAGQLGTNFTARWQVDPNYGDLPATVDSAADVQGKKCGDILRFVCMATGTWPRADASTGYLTAEPLWNQGNKYDLDNLSAYPVIRANDDLSVLIFKLYDEAGTIFTVSGNATASEKTLTINNPFIHTQEQALTAAKIILTQYGGIQLETIGRGDPASEIGDVDTVWLDESTATTARRMEQSFSFVGGILKDCRSVLLQADGSYLYQNRAVITESGLWTPPDGVTMLRVIIGQGGQGSTAGQDGGFYEIGPLGHDVPAQAQNGTAGLPGKIWHGTIPINPGVPLSVYIGKGTAAGAYGDVVPDGEESVFGAYSSAEGRIYEVGYTDIASGASYGRPNVVRPIDGTSDGAAPGVGGYNEIWKYSHNRPTESGSEDIYYKVSNKTNGTPGADGADGFVVVYWDKGA